ncbi:hypothetical protein AVEN_79610-1 [Araneus ventricosus]|uniref:Uncharacterized protein n=1 Tax=Araneus ventricosus TaxID=182803 RepID=A0A4Y2CG81_ARAVE|nr:hypothetical protein AVEN_79610-1 [Araneus ventricosus]
MPIVTSETSFYELVSIFMRSHSIQRMYTLGTVPLTNVNLKVVNGGHKKTSGIKMLQNFASLSACKSKSESFASPKPTLKIGEEESKSKCNF